MRTPAAGWTRLTHISLAPRVETTLARLQEPVTVGIPFPRGRVEDLGALELRQGGAALPLQSRVLERWADGSVRWALLDFRADAGLTDTACELGLRTDVTAAATAGAAPEPTRGPSDVDAGAWVLRVSESPGLSLQFLSNGSDRKVLAEAGLDIVDAEDRRWTVVAERVALEETGPLRRRIAVHGRARCARSRGELIVTVRVDVFPGLPIARLDVTIGNPDRATHPGGIWELGDKRSVVLRDVSFLLRLSGAGGEVSTSCSVAPGQPVEPCGTWLELYQESSGRPNWRSTNHVNARGQIPLRFQGFRLKGGAGERGGLAATPIVVVSGGRSDVALAVPEFWQNFPKALEASPEGIAFRLFPRQFGDAHEIQGGEQKTHSFWVAIGTDPVTENPLDWCRNPLVAAADPEWYCSAEALPFLVPAARETDGRRSALVRATIEGDDGFECQRDVIDEYGWRNFGDVYANHEAVGHAGAHPLVSHYNNQYDVVMGLAGQFMTTGDRRWIGLMDQLTRHVVDIDIYRTVRDKAAFSGGLFWHTFHYLDAGRSSHRSYPGAPGVAGGGPSNEHSYSTGLVLHYFLTGDPASREAAIMLANWIVDMDDGRKTVFRWLARGRTGLASMTADTAFHGPGRGAGNAVATLLNAHRLTGDRRFLRKAEELIGRCVHPDEDIDRHRLLDAERRWSYTVFLQQLGKYLLYKAENGEFDRMYAYARESLLHYARWMAAHEYPYLEKPEILEFPTETWPAQDIRKSDVFYHAAAHAAGEERRGFLKRAGFFFDYSVSTLAGMPTRALARPLAILLTSGLCHGWFSEHPEFTLPAPREVAEFGSPETFVPQKAVALAQAKRLAVAAAAIALLAAALLAVLLLH